MLIIPFVLLGCEIPDCTYLSRPPAVSASQLLQSGILSLQLPECVPALTLSAITSRPTVSYRSSNLLSTFHLAPQIRLRLTTVRVYQLYLLTYLNKLGGLCQEGHPA